MLQPNHQGEFKLSEKKAMPAINRPYLLLKTTSHFAIILYELFTQVQQGAIPLGELPNAIDALRAQIHRLQQDYADQLSCVRPTLDLLLSTIEQLAKGKQQAQLSAEQALYLRALTPLIEQHSAQAAQLQLQGLHQLSMSWLSSKQINLEKTYILIVGARAPKQDLLEQQYFTALRAHYGIDQQNTDSGGIIYAEMLPQQMADLTTAMLIDDLARELHNRHLGLKLLGDKEAMFKDVLGQYAPPVLHELLARQSTPKAPSKCPMQRVAAGALYKFFPTAAIKATDSPEVLAKTTEPTC